MPPRHDDAQGYLPQIEEGCRVCALGGLLLSHIRLYDKVKIHDLMSLHGYADYFVDYETVKELLKDHFIPAQLDLIEAAFEIRVVRLPYSTSDNVLVQEAIFFGKRFRDLKDRFRAIMKNIVSNMGVFKPTEGTHAIKK
jgi:hypothetical protein